MGSNWFTGGVVAAPRGGIQFDFTFNGIRYRPSIKRPPSEANLRRARERLEEIKHQIRLGLFSFEEEFPDYRFVRRLSGTSSARLCSDVFDAYLVHCEARLRRNDMAAATVRSYRKILDGVWRPHLGDLIFSHIRYSRLIAIADGHSWSKKTYNNAISVLKRAFDFGYRDRPVHENPALNLRCARLRKADRPKVDPFSMHDAETLIAAIHRDWGEAQGNYDEFRFFTGLRPSEQIALVASDIDLVQGIISVNKARVSGVDRDKTKTSEDRRVQLCPRALSVLRRHLRLRESLAAAGQIDHEHVFVVETGEPFRSLHHPQRRWRKTLQSLKVRYRRPHTARQTSVSWSLMGRQESAVGCQTTRPQHRDDAARLRGLGGRHRRGRCGGDQAINERDRGPAGNKSGSRSVSSQGASGETGASKAADAPSPLMRQPIVPPGRIGSEPNKGKVGWAVAI